MSLLTYAVHASGADRRRCSPASPRPAVGTYLVQRRLAADGRRHRPRRGHRRRPRPAHRHLPDAGPRSSSRSSARVADRADPRAAAAPAATSRWRCCSTAASPAACCSPASPGRARPTLQRLPLRLDHHDLRRPTSWVTVALAAVVVVVAVGLRPQLFAVAQDQEFARVAGLNVRALQPAGLGAGRGHGHRRDAHRRPAAGQRADGRAGRDRRSSSPGRSGPRCSAAMALGHARLAGRGGGLGVRSTSPPGRDDRAARAGRLRGDLRRSGCCCAGAGGWPRRSPSRPTRRADARAHRRTRGRTGTSTAPDCGHLAVPHGDHVDYVHDGHRHAVAREATMTSTEPACPGAAADPAAAAVAERAGSASTTSAARRRSTTCSRRGGEQRRPGDGLPHPAGARRRRRGRRAAHRGRRGDLPALLATPTTTTWSAARAARTVEVEGPTVERWTDGVAGEHGFTDVSHTLEIFGTCPDCALSGAGAQALPYRRSRAA